MSRISRSRLLLVVLALAFGVGWTMAPAPEGGDSVGLRWIGDTNWGR